MADEILRTTASFTTPMGKKLAKVSGDLTVVDTSIQPLIYATYHTPTKSWSKVTNSSISKGGYKNDFKYPILNLGDEVVLSIDIFYDSLTFYNEYLTSDIQPTLWMESLGEQGGASLSKADWHNNVTVTPLKRTQYEQHSLVRYDYTVKFPSSKGVMLTKESLAFYAHLTVVPGSGEGAGKIQWKTANKLCLTNDKYWYFVPTFTFDGRPDLLVTDGRLINWRLTTGGGAGGGSSYSGGSNYPPGGTGGGLEVDLHTAISGYGDPKKAEHNYPTATATIAIMFGGKGGDHGVWGNGSAYHDGSAGQGGRVNYPTQEILGVLHPLGIILKEWSTWFSNGTIRHGDTAPGRNRGTPQTVTYGDINFTNFLTKAPHKRGRYMDALGGMVASGIGAEGSAYGGEGGGGALVRVGMSMALASVPPEVLATGYAGAMYVVPGGVPSWAGRPGTAGGAGGTLIYAANPYIKRGRDYLFYGEAMYVPNLTGTPMGYVYDIYFSTMSVEEADKALYPNG